MFFNRKKDLIDCQQQRADLQRRLDAFNQNLATIRFKPDGSIIEANTFFAGVLGYIPEEIIDKHHRMFCDKNLINTSEYHKFWQDLANGIAQRGTFKRIHKNGGVMWIEATYFPLKDENGKVVEVLKSRLTSQKIKIS